MSIKLPHQVLTTTYQISAIHWDEIVTWWNLLHSLIHSTVHYGAPNICQGFFLLDSEEKGGNNTRSQSSIEFIFCLTKTYNKLLGTFILPGAVGGLAKAKVRRGENWSGKSSVRKWHLRRHLNDQISHAKIRTTGSAKALRLNKPSVLRNRKITVARKKWAGEEGEWWEPRWRKWEGYIL